MDEQLNPMESVINIVDAFLVCMVGVLAMLVIFYNVDIVGKEVKASQTVPDAVEIQDISDQLEDPDNSKYQKMGIVYQDATTGKMYVVSDEETPD
jgi:hypothetical protein